MEGARKDFEATTDTNGDGNIEHTDMLIDEVLLLRSAESDKDNMRPGLLDFSQYWLKRVFTRFEPALRTAHTGNLKTRVAPA